MRIWKSHPLISLVNGYLVDSPQPSNLSYLWNFGSLLGVCLVIQIVSGITLAMHYNPSVLESFNSVEHIMRDVNNGWLIRYLHSNTASAFFFLVYMHIGRGLYYGSYRAPRTLVWTLGTVILILMIVTAFLGYKHSPKWLDIYYKLNHSVTVYKYNTYVSNNNTKGSPGWAFKLSRAYSTKRYIDHTTEKNRLLDLSLNQLGIDPIYSYTNLSLESTKKQISQDLRGLSGIYMIYNMITHDYYVGSAATNRFYSRFSNHLIYYRGSKVVKLSVKKYGLDNFSFIILDLYPDVVTKENNKELIDLEDKYLKLLSPNYNILTEAGSSFGYKHTEISRQKMKDIYSDLRREKIGSLNRGRIFSIETIDKMRESALKKVPLSEAAKTKCIVNNKPVILYNLDKTVYGKYTSIVEAAKDINCGEKTIRRALKTDKKLVKRQWIVEYTTK